MKGMALYRYAFVLMVLGWAYRLTGNCYRYMPREDGLCRVCRVPGAGREV